MISAGGLDQNIQIQSVSTTADAMGAPVETWAAVSGAPEWAEFIPLRGLERIEAGKISGVVPVKMRIRRCSDVNEKCRVVYGTQTFRILSIEDYGRDGEMILHCEEVR